MRAWLWSMIFLILGFVLPRFVDENVAPFALLVCVTVAVILALTTPQVRRSTSYSVVRSDDLRRLREVDERQKKTKDWEGGLRRLGELRAEGVQLRGEGEHATSRNAVSAFIERADEWEERTGVVIDGLSATDAAFFRVIDRFENTYAIRGSLSPEHNMALAVLNERLARLGRFMEHNRERERE